MEEIPMHFRYVVLCLIEEMPTAVLNGAFLKDANGRDFLLVVDVHREIQSVQDAAMFHLKVASTFEFPVVLAWLETGEWRMAGPQPWKAMAERTDLLALRLYQIPVSDADAERRLRERKKAARGDL
jgi:hypothetical protein